VTKGGINLSCGSLEEIEKGTGLEVRLLEVQVELCALGLGVRKELSDDLGLNTSSQCVVELNLGIESVERGPRLRQSNTCDNVRLLRLVGSIPVGLSVYFASSFRNFGVSRADKFLDIR
jgi:hypothetical protein